MYLSAKKLFNKVNFVFSSSTSFRAVNNIFPVLRPFLSPLKVSFAFWTIFNQFNFHFWFGDLNLVLWRGNPCFDFLPVTLFRHSLNEEVFKFVRIKRITSLSSRSNWKLIASNGVLSSHAISIMRSISLGVKYLTVIFFKLLN